MVRKLILGEEDSTIDDKGRILVPKKKRERLGEDFTLALGQVGCVTAYPQWSFEKYAAKVLDDEDILNFGRDRFSRIFMSTAEDEIKFDAQGRCVIPQRLRQLGLLSGAVKLVGAGDRLEFWDMAEWRKYEQDEKGYGAQRRERLAAALREIGGRDL